MSTLTKLLTLRCRRNTILPELVTFFQMHAGEDWAELLELFVKMFAGTDFRVPGPEMLAELRRDQTILRRFHHEPGVLERIAMLREFAISYEHLNDLWMIQHDRPLSTPTDGPAAAADLIRQHPGQRAGIESMYGLKPAPKRPPEPSRAKAKPARRRARR